MANTRLAALATMRVSLSHYLVMLRPAAEHVPALLPGVGAGAGAVEPGVPLAHAVNVARAVLGAQDGWKMNS